MSDTSTTDGGTAVAEQYLTAKQVAELWGLVNPNSERMVIALTKREESPLPCVTLGTGTQRLRRRFVLSVVNEWAKRQRPGD